MPKYSNRIQALGRCAIHYHYVHLCEHMCVHPPIHTQKSILGNRLEKKQNQIPNTSTQHKMAFRSCYSDFPIFYFQIFSPIKLQQCPVICSFPHSHTVSQFHYSANVGHQPKMVSLTLFEQVTINNISSFIYLLPQPFLILSI